MSKYKYLLFDNDGTIMDFEKAEQVAFESCYNSYDFPVKFTTAILETYSKINHSWWEKLERGECSKDELSIGRFTEFLEHMNLQGDALHMSKNFPKCLAMQNQLLPNILEILEKLNQKYEIIIITNGIASTQYSRIETSPINKFIDKIYVSEETGYAKPAKEFFEYVLENSKIKDKSKCLIIGDRLKSDIQGANNIGIDSVWFNPNAEINSECDVTYEISDLLELENILLFDV